MVKYSERRKQCIIQAFGDYKVSLIVTTNLHESMKRRHIPFEPNDSHTSGLHSFGGGNSTIMVTENAAIKTIAHECWHAVREIFSWTEAKMDNELVAYCLGYLTEQLYNLVYRRVK